jgi:hypothetical protein
MADLDGTDEFFDSRDVIERIEELTAEWNDATEHDSEEFHMSEDDWAVGLGEGGAAEIVALLAFRGQFGSEFEDGITFILESDFENYARDLLQDIGELPRDIPDYIVIDWEATADNLSVDYSEVEFRGETYLYRA